MSLIEHQVHRKLMHRKNFLSARTASFKRVFEAHTLVHHKHYGEIFSLEPVAPGEDKEIRLTVRKAPIKAIPFAAPIAFHPADAAYARAQGAQLDSEFAAGERVGPFRAVGVPGKSPGEVATRPA